MFSCCELYLWLYLFSEGHLHRSSEEGTPEWSAVGYGSSEARKCTRFCIGGHHVPGKIYLLPKLVLQFNCAFSSELM